MPIPVGIYGGPANLTWYIGQDACLYAHELQTNCLFKIYEDISDLAPPPVDAGLPEAPTDGQLYGRENEAWAVVPSGASNAVQKIGDTMTGTLTINDPANPAIAIQSNAQIQWHGGPSIFYQSADNYIYVDNCSGLRLNPDGAVVVFHTGGNYTKLGVDANGDLIATAWIGPNAGKSVNLTAGKWA